MSEATVEQWRERAEHWKRVADSEATKCADEDRQEIARLRHKIKCLERILARYGINQ